MTSQPGKQTIVRQILLNVSESKGNLTMKFSQLIENNKRYIFLQNHAENESRRLVPDLSLFSKKAL